MEEIWKPVVGYEGLYEVSNLGKVKSLHYMKTNTSRLLVLRKNNQGRLMIELRKNGQKKYVLVHRLVAETFIPNPNNYPQINHIDENPENNRVDNLEWCTGKQNIKAYAKNHPEFFRAIQEKGLKVRRRNRERAINQYDVDGCLIKQWISANEIETKMGWKAENIIRCCNGQAKSFYGFKWCYNH